MVFENIASNAGKGRVYKVQKTIKLERFQGLGDFQRSFGHVGTWLNILKLSGRASYLSGYTQVVSQTPSGGEHVKLQKQAKVQLT